MGRIRLEDMEFFAYHGYYEEERKIGNKYSVTLEVEIDFSRGAREDDLSGTINYEELYKIVKEVMERPTKLLENLGRRVIDDIQHQFGKDTNVEVTISKHNPPIGGVCAKSTIIIKNDD